MGGNVKMFPRTMVGGVSLPRFIIGTNWMAGYSHKTPSADRMIQEKFADPQATVEMLLVFLEYGIDAIIGKFENTPHMVKAIKMAEDKTGKSIIIIDTPAMNMDDNPAARREAEESVKFSKQNGATFCFPHAMSCEQLLNKNKQIIERLPDYLSMVRQHGMIPGLSTHTPEMMVYSDLNNYDVETYVQPYNCMGFLMQAEIELIHQMIWKAKKPVMTIKPMAAGRVTPFIGLTFNWATVRPCDMVCIGCHTPGEALEDIKLSFSALEDRRPVLDW